MYGRALLKLKTILHSKGLQDSSNVISNNNFGLIHFHIDAGGNDILLNKFETKTPIGGVKALSNRASVSMDKRSLNYNSSTFGVINKVPKLPIMLHH